MLNLRPEGTEDLTWPQGTGPGITPDQSIRVQLYDFLDGVILAEGALQLQ